MIIELDGIPIQITKKSIKNINLRVYPPDGTVKLSAPLNYSHKTIDIFLKQHKPWIHQQRERIFNQPQKVAEVLDTGNAVSVQGKSYLVMCTEHNGPTKIDIQGELLYCYVRPNTTPAQKQILFEQWCRAEMNAQLPSLIKKWEAIIGVHVNEWGVKKMKTRWGSCNIHAKRIWLNLNLMQKAPGCLECVLVHELVHLLEPSHNTRFYALMTQFMPNWKEFDKLLK